MRQILSSPNNMRDFSTIASFWNDKSACSGFDLFCTSFILSDIDLVNYFQNLDYVTCLSQFSELQLHCLFWAKCCVEFALILSVLHVCITHISVCVQQRGNKLSDFAAWLLIPVIFSDSLFSSYVPILALIVKTTVLLFWWKLPSNTKSFKSGGSLLNPPEIQKLPWLEIDFGLLNTCVLAHN